MADARPSTKDEVLQERGARRRIEFSLPGRLCTQIEAVARREKKSMTNLLLEVLANDPRLEVRPVDFLDLRRRQTPGQDSTAAGD